MKAIAPGKVILTGEHAVVYGKPALVAAVNRYATAEAKRLPGRAVRLVLEDLGFEGTYSWEEIVSRCVELEGRYEAYRRGELSVGEIAPQPDSLFLHLLGNLRERVQGSRDLGVELRIRSQLPRGGGMGSSAATLAAAATAVSAELGLELSGEGLYELVLRSENLQHGRSSGVDPAIAVFGGMLRFQQGTRRALPVRRLEFRLVYTGPPESTTGEAVDMVARKNPVDLWDSFEQVAGELEAALMESRSDGIIDAVRKNHRLLCEIGVVPERVQRFVERVEALGGGAKISGAGAVKGERAGVVLVFGADDDLPHVCTEFGCELLEVVIEERGARVL